MSISSSRPNFPGFTLIETLAVVVIAAMSAGALLVFVGSSDDVVRVMRTKAEVRRLDAEARMLARTSGRSTTLGFNDQTRSMKLVESKSEDFITCVSLERPCWFQQTDGRAIESIAYDRCGCSADFQAIIEASSSNVILSFAGLTGDVEEEQSR